MRVILADSDVAFLSRVNEFLKTQPGLTVAAKVDSCKDALLWCEELRPDILLLDWHLMFEGLMPTPMKGEEIVRRVKELKPSPAIIVASRLSLDDHRNAAIAAGADEFMPKARFPELLRPLIQRLTPRF